LGYSRLEPWCSADVLNLDILKKQLDSPNPIIPCNSKSSHPESNLFCTLFSFIKLPSPRLLREWAKIVALSIQTICDENPKAPQVQSGTKSMRQNVVVLTWLNTFKSTMPNLLQISYGDPETSEISQVGVNPSDVPTVDLLDELQKIIIDVIMSYRIFQAHSQDQFNPHKKKENQQLKISSRGFR
jgi:hypothetical protein